MLTYIRLSILFFSNIEICKGSQKIIEKMISLFIAAFVACIFALIKRVFVILKVYASGIAIIKIRLQDFINRVLAYLFKFLLFHNYKTSA